MESRQQALRTIVLKLNVSGTAEVLDETKLYKDGYGFVKLQVYAPKTQNTQAPACTVFCTTQNEFGIEQISDKNHNLLYVGEYSLDGQVYLLFESYLPKEFTSVTTPINGLKITLNYYDTAPTFNGSGKPILDANGVPKRHTTNLLVSSRYITTVYPGGWNNSDIELDINSAEAAQINENMRNIAELQSDTMGLHNVLDNTIDGLDHEIERATDAESALDERIKLVENITLPPDCTEANNVGEARVVMKPNGGLKFIDIKGEKGDTGEFSIGTVKTVDYTETATVTNSGTTSDAVLDFEIPQGKPAFVKIGKVVTLPPESEAKVINVGTDNDPILDIYIPAGIGFRADKTYPSIEAMNLGFATDGVRLYGFVVINTGNVEDDDNAKLFMKTETEYMFVTDMSGIQGIKGEAATIEIAKMTEVLEPGATPSVENSGDQHAAVLKFKLPSSATVDVDNDIISLDENEQARVENIGSKYKAVLKFYLPRGKRGDPANIDELNARYYWEDNPPPIATADTYGTVKLGSNVTQIEVANTVTNNANRTYAVQRNKDDQLVVNIPWTDTNTTYSAGTGLSISGGTINHKNSVTANNNVGGNANATLKYSGTFTVPYFSYDAQGHITASGTKTYTLPASDNTDTHHISYLYVGISTASANSATTNGNTYLVLRENGTTRNAHKISGSGATTVTSDASGNIAITSPVISLYEHNIIVTASLTGPAVTISLPPIYNTSNTAFTADSLKTYLTSRGYTTYSKCMPITGGYSGNAYRGLYYSGSNLYLVSYNGTGTIVITAVSAIEDVVTKII